MTGRNAWIAATVVVVLAIVVVVGLQRRQGDVAVGSPTPTASTRASAAASPAATVIATATASGSAATPGGSALYNDAFGFIVTDAGTVASFRRESSDARLSSFDQQGFAVSPDGLNVAFWAPGAPVQLRILGGVSELTLVTLAAGARGGGIAWSSDGAAILYSTETGSFGVGGGTNSATLNIYELGASGRHGTTIDSQTNTGWLYRPIGWDRSTNLAAAGLTGEGASLSFYVMVRINADGTSDAQRVDTRSGGMSMGSVHASSDAKYALGIEGSGNIVSWPLGHIETKRAAPGTGRSVALWQPGTHKIGFIGADDGFVLFDPDDGSVTTPFRGVAGSAVQTFRADGSAVVLAPIRGGLGATSYTLYRLSDGASVTFQELGRLDASVKFR